MDRVGAEPGRVGRRVRGPGLRRAALLAAALLSSVAGAEALLRAFDLPSGRFDFLGPELAHGRSFAADPELFWRLAPGAEDYAANRLGLRGELPPDEKAPGELRLACVGDSTTFGLGVDLEQTWCHRLGATLDRGEGPVTTILAALPGYSTYQDRVLFDRHVAPLGPDVTVLYPGGWNDFLPAIGASDAERGRRGPPAFERWHLARLAQAAWARDEAERERYLAALRSGAAPDGRRVSLAESRENLEALVASAEAVGSRVVLVRAPLPSATERDFPGLLAYRSLAGEVAARRQVPLFDAAALFAARHAELARRRGDAPATAALFQDFIHPTAAGHALLAQGLAAHLAGSRPR